MKEQINIYFADAPCCGYPNEIHVPVVTKRKTFISKDGKRMLKYARWEWIYHDKGDYMGRLKCSQCGTKLTAYFPYAFGRVTDTLALIHRENHEDRTKTKSL